MATRRADLACLIAKMAQETGECDRDGLVRAWRRWRVESGVALQARDISPATSDRFRSSEVSASFRGTRWSVSDNKSEGDRVREAVRDTLQALERRGAIQRLEGRRVKVVDWVALLSAINDEPWTESTP